MVIFLLCSLSMIKRFHVFLMQYQLLVDKYANQLHQAPEFELHNFYGQILRFLVFDIPTLSTGRARVGPDFSWPGLACIGSRAKSDELA